MSPVEQVWARRAELQHFRRHVAEVRNREHVRGTGHHAAEHAFKVAFALAKFVAVPWAIDLSVADVLELARMVADPEVVV